MHLPSAIGHQVKEELQAHQDHQAELLRDLADKMSEGKKVFATKSVVMKTSTPEKSPSPCTPSPPTQKMAYCDVSLTIRHPTLQSLVDEWFGHGAY